MKQLYKKIAIIGGGVMGTILTNALVKTNASKHIVVCEKSVIHHKKLEKINLRVKATSNFLECVDAEVIFLAVKPQDFNSVKLKINKSVLICSIMAGVSIANIRNQLNVDKVIRMMPNTGARVGESFTAWTATKKVSTIEKKWVEEFLTQMGDQFYVKDEKQIDKITAITGSGPAYIFNTLSVFMKAAVKLGFKEKEAYRMVRQVLRGVNALTDGESNFTELTQQITSKGGTTEAALKVFTDSKLEKIWKEAVNAAYKKAQELSKQK